MQSLKSDGYLVELGPNSLMDTSPVLRQIIEETGISGEVQTANSIADKRYILRNGELHNLPTSPPAFLSSKLFSIGGKLRLLAEPFHGKAKNDESIASFVRRRVGREFLDYAVNPFIGGIYAGNPEKLSVRQAMPKLYALEEKYGGLVLGMIRGAKERKKRSEKSKLTAKSISFADGMEFLPKTIAKSLGNSLKLNSTVTFCTKSKYSGWEIGFKSGETEEKITADTVIFALPAYKASELLRNLSPEVAELLEKIYYPPVAEIALGFRTEQIGVKLDGFGALIPEKESRSILGALWNSATFSGRAPAGCELITIFAGGTRQPEVALLDDNKLLETALNDLRSMMKITGEPEFVNISRWKRAIPQYSMDYKTILDTLEKFETENKGMYFYGNYRGGISVGDCLNSAGALAEKIEKEI